jgi:hypothetical protein
VRMRRSSPTHVGGYVSCVCMCVCVCVVCVCRVCACACASQVCADVGAPHRRPVAADREGHGAVPPLHLLLAVRRLLTSPI